MVTVGAYRDLKVGDVVYVVTEHRVTAVGDSTATLDGNIVTPQTAVDESQQIMLGIVYREQ